MRAVPWPSVAKIAEHKLDIAPHYRGGESRYGHTSFEIGSGAHFAGVLSVVPMRSADALTFRAFLHSLRGQAGTFGLALYYVGGALVPASPGGVSLPLTGVSGYSDTTEYSDGTEYADGTITETTLSALAAADAATVSVTSASGIAVGRIISINGQLCRVVSVDGTTVGIRPRLRAAAASGALVTFNGAVGLFRLDDETPAVPLIVGRSLPVQLKIREAY